MESGLTKKQKVIKITLITTSIVLSVLALILSYYTIFVNNKDSVKINLNDGVKIFNEEWIELEPGYSVEREFFIKNEGTQKVYYKVYIENLSGTLVEATNVTISSGDIILFSGAVTELAKDNAQSLDSELNVNEKRILKIKFSLSEKVGNVKSNGKLKFDICAMATKADNNPDRIFSKGE
ncbi:MAG: hypothetical protein IJW43_03065 [Clostridia bacterium]|nr:hypothetical protein [Clostridia bacterium]